MYKIWLLLLILYIYLSGHVTAWKKGAHVGKTLFYSARHLSGLVLDDNEEYFYLAQPSGNRIIRYTKVGQRNHVVTGQHETGSNLYQLILDAPEETLLVGGVTIIVGANGEENTNNELSRPNGVTFDSQGNLYVSNYQNNQVQRFAIETTSMGCLGNFLNIFLLSKKALRTISCNNSSSFTNLLILTVGLATTVYVYDRPWAVSQIFCQSRNYLVNACQQISRFMIIAACFDRFALCSTNFHLRQFCRTSIARYYVIPSVIIVWLIFPIYTLISITVVNNSCIYLGTVALYNSIYGITMVGFAPPTLMATFSLLTFYNLKVKQQRRQQVRQPVVGNGQGTATENRKQQKKDQQVLAMLMIQVVFYISTTTIASANLLYSTLTTYSGVDKSNERKSIESFILFITGTMNYTCPCLSFYLFYFASRLYRRQMKLALLTIRRHYCCCRFERNQQRVSMRPMTARVGPIDLLHTNEQ
ncbi:unnamed protein product [Adineta ricciae]|uniref:G-protein coupled receptors family 1 profile domain-containing protein n=1 Tax=Adineta ricciae TaxID=249248 RepID=A0A813YL75_ADIRI|nr:unnamed protein product [Adineta ricciae]